MLTVFLLESNLIHPVMVAERKAPLAHPGLPPAKVTKRAVSQKGSFGMLARFFFILLILFYYEENATVPIRRSERSTRGQGGELQRKQIISEAVQPRQGLPKEKKSNVQGIPSDAAINPMAPISSLAKRSKRGKVDVGFGPSHDVSAINKSHITGTSNRTREHAKACYPSAGATYIFTAY
jgi:hypothetical protein